MRDCRVVSYAFVQDVAATWEQYERVARAVRGPVPDGLIIHVAGPTDEGYRVIEIWEDEAAWERFQVERLTPAAVTDDGPASPQPTFRDLRPEHIVVGRTHSFTREDARPTPENDGIWPIVRHPSRGG